jgi:formate dehydrogenase major subunit
MFVEVSPELAAERGLEHMGWCHVITARAAVEGRVMVTDRLTPLRVEDRIVHQVWMPYHWGAGGMVTGDSANDLFGISLDPNVLIQESKVGTCDVRPGRRPTGRALLEYIADYHVRAGIINDQYAPIVTTGPGAASHGDGDPTPNPSGADS